MTDAIDGGCQGPIIEVDGVTCGYSDDRCIVKDVSFRIDEPEFVCIIGPNGVGKSTLIRCLNGLIAPTEGSIRVFGRDVEDYSLRDLSKVMGYVPTSTQEFNAMTVLDTVLVGRYSRQRWRTTAADISVAYKALKTMEIDDLAGKRFNELSAGQHQKVAIARGLVQEPSVLVLDEPTSNLDVRHQVYTMALLRELSKRTGTTVVMISHDLNLAAKYADRIIVMEMPGVLYGIGTPGEMITRDMVRRVYNVDCEIADDHGKPHVVLQDVMERSEYCFDFASACCDRNRVHAGVESQPYPVGGSLDPASTRRLDACPDRSRDRITGCRRSLPYGSRRCC